MESQTRNARKVREGVVVSNKMNKTVTVEVVTSRKHPKYKKAMDRKSKYYAHDETDQLEIGARVQIMESRPYSKLKKWVVVEKLEKQSKN